MAQQTQSTAVAGHAFVKGVHGVRYQVADVARSVAFYTQHLGFTLQHQQLPAFANVSLGDAQILLERPRRVGLAADAGRASAGAGRLEPRRAEGGGSARLHRSIEEGRTPLPQRDGNRSRRPPDPGGRSRRQSHRALRTGSMTAFGRSEPGVVIHLRSPVVSGALEFSDACIDIRRRSGSPRYPDSPWCSWARSCSPRSQRAPTPPAEEPRRGDAPVARRRQEGLRRELRRLPRPQGRGLGEGRRHHLDHPGAGRQAAARPDRRPVGPRLDRRRDLHGHQEGRAADDDGRVGGADLGHRDLAHRQLPARPRGEPGHGWTRHRRAGGGRAHRSQAGAAARRLRAAADHG